MKKYCLVLLFASYVGTSTTAAIFWDLGRTLLSSRKLFILQKACKPHILQESFTFTLQNPRTSYLNFVVERFLQTLRLIPYNAKTSYVIYSDDGKTPLPSLLADSINGFLSLAEMSILYKKWHKNNLHYFKSSAEKSTFNVLLDATLNPSSIVKASKPSPLINIMHKCATQKDSHGNKKHVNIILSNWINESIEPFKKKYEKTIMAYMDDTIFSGEVHMSKPHHSIYNYCYDLVRNKFPEQLNEPFFFIDDQEINLEGARKNTHHTFICALPHQAETILKTYKII